MRLIQLHAAHAGPTNATVWINTDKIVKLEEKKGEGTRIYHEPYDQETQSLDQTDVEETAMEIARKAHEPIEISLGSEPVYVALTEWPRGRLPINT
jgi:hypothetical protein